MSIKIVLITFAVSSLVRGESAVSLKSLLDAQRSMKNQMEWMNDLLNKQQAEIESLKQLESKATVSRTCEDIYSLDPTSKSGYYYVDPDGSGSGDPPIYVYCDMTTRTTIVSHDSENTLQASACSDPGCYSRPVLYNATMRQMVALAELSTNCRQKFRFDCLGVPLEFDNINFAWWNGRNTDLRHYYWAGSYEPDYHTCSCGDGCLELVKRCNCDSMLLSPQNDEGFISNKNELPITRLNFGRTSAPSTYGRHTLGKFECGGRASLNRLPESCDDLWKSGQTVSNFYTVKGTDDLKTVYCNFTKIPGDEGIQTDLGSLDVKTPVYFHVRRNSSYAVANSTIPFEIEIINIGEFMNVSDGVFTAPVAGVYYFTFHASKSTATATTVDLYVNEEISAVAQVGSTNDYLSISLSATVTLKEDDKVWLLLRTGSLASTVGAFATFNGFLLQQQFS